MSGNLPEFLLARIAEIKEAARWNQWDAAPHTARCGYDQIEFGTSCVCGVPARVLAECEAKRKIVELACLVVNVERVPTGRPGVFDKRLVYASCRDEYDEVLRLLALPYADHPDYDEAWKP